MVGLYDILVFLTDDADCDQFQFLLKVQVFLRLSFRDLDIESSLFHYCYNSVWLELNVD